MSDTRTIVINDVEHEVPTDVTLIQACEMVGIEIPRFCYHERLSIAGNCRMCLVELVGAPKPVASCAFAVRDMRGGRNGEPPAMRTNSPMVKKAREGVMEFLLINHPLDCPICDQGGECDLQDQAMAYGVDSSRFALNKRAVDEKFMGPLIKTVMPRCIHCTRCVRFATEVAGVPELGATGRGEDMEITTYLEQAMTSELSGNVIDLCPVGALTSKPYAFTARPWELKKTETIDVMDAVGANIRVDTRGRGVMRIMPRGNDAVNEEWLSDKSRFIWDGLARQRLDQPYVRRDGKLQPASWDEAFATIAAEMKQRGGEDMAAIAGDLCDVESMWALRELFRMLGSPNTDCRQDGAVLPTDNRAGYIFNSGIAGIDAADAILIVGSSPRLEAPVLNARIRRAWLERGIPIAMIGEAGDLTYDYETIGAGPASLADLVAGNHSFFEVMKRAERPMIILGQGALARTDGAAVLHHAMVLAEELGVVNDAWNGFNVLHTAAARVGGLDCGFVPGENGLATDAILDACGTGEVSLVWLLGADEIDISRLGEAFVVYQGSHGDVGAHRADVILPGAAYTEKDGLYINTEGRPQMARRAVFPPGDAREDWAIVRAFSGVVGKTLPFNSVGDLRSALIEAVPHAINLGAQTPAVWQGAAGHGGELGGAPFRSPVVDFYLTNPIARASKVMAECSALTRARAAERAA